MLVLIIYELVSSKTVQVKHPAVIMLYARMIGHIHTKCATQWSNTKMIYQVVDINGLMNMK